MRCRYRGGLTRRRGQTAYHLVEEIADAEPVLGGNLDNGLESEPVELERAVAGAAVVRFVDGDHNRHAVPAQRLRDFVVSRHGPLPAIDHEDEQVDGSGGAADAFGDGLLHGVQAGPNDTPGVDQRENATLPLDRAAQYVARGARHGADNGAPGTGQSIEQGRFADVGSADEGDLAVRSCRGTCHAGIGVRRLYA